MASADEATAAPKSSRAEHCPDHTEEPSNLGPGLEPAHPTAVKASRSG